MYQQGFFPIDPAESFCFFFTFSYVQQVRGGAEEKAVGGSSFILNDSAVKIHVLHSGHPEGFISQRPNHRPTKRMTDREDLKEEKTAVKYRFDSAQVGGRCPYNI